MIFEELKLSNDEIEARKIVERFTEIAAADQGLKSARTKANVHARRYVSANTTRWKIKIITGQTDVIPRSNNFAVPALPLANQNQPDASMRWNARARLREAMR